MINSRKPGIKSENEVILDKFTAVKSPQPFSEPKMNSYINSANLHDESQLIHPTGTSLHNSMSKSVCETASCNSIVTVSSCIPAPISSTCATSLISLHSQSMNGYLGVDSSEIGFQPQLSTRSAFDTSHSMMSNHLSLDDQYIREQQLRYSQIAEINSAVRPPISYPNDIMSRSVSYDLGPRTYDTIPISTPANFERYDANCLSQRANMYPYMQPTMEDLNNQQKYLREQHQIAQTIIKTEQHDETPVPLYPRPVYHYDPTGTPLPSGFSAINLSVKVAAAQAAAFKATSMPSIGPGPAIDLSASGNIVSSSGHDFVTSQFGAPKLNGSPPNTSSPQIGSPVSSPVNEQSLDLSVSRMPHSTSPYNSSQAAISHNQGFSGPRSPQTEPVDFSAAPPRQLNFSLVGPIGQFSRESTPDSATASHYIDGYRGEPNGKLN